MAHRPPHVGRDQVDHLGDGGGEALDAQLMVHKDGAYARAGQQVVHVVVGPRQIGHFGLQFSVDRGQFLVDRLQLLLGGLQFLVGGLQFLVHGLHFFVGGFELLVGSFHFLVGGLEVFLLGPQFLLQRRDAGVNVRGALAGTFAGICTVAVSALLLVHHRRFLEDDQKQASAWRPLPCSAVTGRTVRWTVVNSPLVLTRSPGWCTGSLWATALRRALVNSRRNPSRAIFRMFMSASPGAGSRYWPVRPWR